MIFLVARFHRTNPAPKIRARKNYRAFRRYVEDDFVHCCAYCLRHEDWADGAETYEIDHFRPHSLFPDLICVFDNLYYACHRCNHRKLDRWPSEELLAQGIGFVDFCQDDFETHYELMPDGFWKPLTESARYTLRMLRLNSDDLVRQRVWAIREKFLLDRERE